MSAPQVMIWARREVKGWNGERDPETLRDIPRHRVVDLHEALDATYPTDAHFVPYVVAEHDGEVPQRPFRINKRGLVELREDGADVVFGCVVVDVDAPKAIRNREGVRRAHGVARWYRGQKAALLDSAPALAASCWSYATRGGLRFLWLLAETLSAEPYERLNLALREELERVTTGRIKPDPLPDWTRCYRLPNVQRDGRTSASVVDAGEGVLDVDALPEPAEKKKRQRLQGLDKASTALDAVKIVREPGRNTYLTRVAGAYRRAGMEIDELAPALHARNERTCEPPVDEDEVDSIALSICGYDVGDDGDEGDLDPERERGLDTGSEVEVALMLLDSMEGLRGEPLAYDYGELWRYSDERGIWAPVRKPEITGMLVPFDGSVYGSEKTPSRLKVSAKFATGVYQLGCELRDAPGYFDNDSPGVVFLNGLVRLDARGGLEITDHNPDARKRFALPYDYHADAKAPRWRAFLDEVFEGDDDAKEKHNVLQEFVGACLLGQATRYQRALLLVGEGANGKSVFLNTIAELFPAEGRAAVAPQDLADQYNRATLAGVAINVVTEMPERELVASEALKAMIDGSVVRARHPYGRPFDYRASAGQLFAANDLPSVRDTSHGFWRRWIALSFNRTFSVPEQDKRLEETLKGELAGIAVWALEGVARLLKRDEYTVPASSIATRDEWRLNSDSVAAFVADCLDVGGEYLAAASALYAAYKSRCEVHGLRPVGSPNFGKRLKRLGVGQTRRASGSQYTARIRPRASAPKRGGAGVST